MTDPKKDIYVVEQVVATITTALEEIGYSQLALSYIYDTLVEGLLAEDEETFSELLLAMQEIREIDDQLQLEESEYESDQVHIN